MAQILAVLGIAAAVGGKIQAGRVASAEGKSAENIAKYNAQVQEREAQAARQKARFEQLRQAKRAEGIKGATTARLAAAGGLGSPVAADIAAEEASELELENLLIGYEGEITAKRAESQAQLDRLQGKLYRKKGQAEAQAQYIKAGTTLLQGFNT